MIELNERIKALEEAYTSDEVFAAEFKRAVNAYSIEDAIKLAAAKGVELSADDFAPNAAALQERELDDSELEAVAGGDFLEDLGCFLYLMMSFAS